MVAMTFTFEKIVNISNVIHILNGDKIAQVSSADHNTDNNKIK